MYWQESEIGTSRKRNQVKMLQQENSSLGASQFLKRLKPPLSSNGTGMYAKPKTRAMHGFDPQSFFRGIPVITIFITGKILSKP
jgi:hypothetical protein